MRRHIKQVSFITNDLERSLEQWVQILRIGPWSIVTLDHKDFEHFLVYGKKIEQSFAFTIATTMVGELQLEVIQPLHGPMIYWEETNRFEFGLFAVKEKLSEQNMQVTKEVLQQRGTAISQEGKFLEDEHCYFDTRKLLHFTYQIGNCPEVIIPEERITVYPAEL